MFCNLYEMNSWHAWSPNSKWIVFVSKAFGPYTDMYLTHIDKKGRSSIPVLIERSRKQKQVANYPEFLNVESDYTFNMVYNYVNISHIQRAIKANDIKSANELLEKYLNQKQISMPSEYFALWKSILLLSNLFIDLLASSFSGP